jgi:tripartite-type tricarboxylate transporter receptor subunit TctC
VKLRFLASLVALLAVVATVGDVAAQPYPSRPIKLVVPYGPGGAGDVIARIVSEQLAKDLGVSVVVGKSICRQLLHRCLRRLFSAGSTN